MEVSENLNQDENKTRPQFGNRFLNESENVFAHNAWDNVEWDEELEQNARESVKKNSVVTLTEDQLKNYEEEADKYWDTFYGVHQNRFFKDRHWLFTEFKELAPDYNNAPERVYPSSSSNEIESSTQSSSSTKIKGPRTIFEIGCGVGNTIIPILKYSQEADLMVYGCDFSQKAIEIFQEHPEYDQKRCNTFVLDATSDIWNVPFDENSVDIIVLIFVLSAINPSKMQHVANQCYKYLKNGGTLILRDYGRFDLAQLRFKPGKCLQENFYVRGDGTRVYFFTQEELKTLFENAGLVETQNLIDRRLQVNRGKMLKMYRVWIQTKFKKPE